MQYSPRFHHSILLCLAVFVGNCFTTTSAFAFAPSYTAPFTATASTTRHATLLCLSSSTKEKTTSSEDNNNIEETTEKYGLEVGLWQSFRQSKDGGESAKSLLKKYGLAYLATSIPLALVSFALCYVLVDHGVDVAAFLSRFGIAPSETADKAGTAALAYAAHKAASPLRFPPTVLLTPVVAKLLGKEANEDVEEAEVEGKA